MKSNESYSAYFEYNKILRAWLVGYGVGLPLVLFANPMVLNAVKKSGDINLIAYGVVLGVFFQIISSLVNKICNWYVYRSYADDVIGDCWKFKFATKIIKKFWIDWVLDLSSILAFGLSTYWLLQSMSLL